MKVVILCGGKGTRLREETEHRPKPMVPIGSKPILWHIMRIYAKYGHKEFILCLGYKGEMIKSWFRNLLWMTSDVRIRFGNESGVHFYGDSEESDWTVTLADTGEDTMTGARIKKIEKYLESDEDFLLTYGDGVGNIDVNAAIKFHRKSGCVLTVTGVRPPGRWGELGVNQGKVVFFDEKPQTSTGRISGGFFVAKRELFGYLTDDPMLSFEREPLNKLVKAGELACYEHDGFWQPMDTYQEFMLLNRLWREGKADWKIW